MLDPFPAVAGRGDIEEITHAARSQGTADPNLT
jgi:hypothetical protein